MKAEYLNEVPEIKRKKAPRIGANVEIIEKFLLNDAPVLKLTFKIGKDKDCDYYSMNVARCTWRASMKRIGAEKSLDMYTDRVENALYFVKKVSVSNASKESSVDTYGAGNYFNSGRYA